MRTLRYISLLFLLVISGFASAQSWTGQAYDFYKAKDFETAKQYIDSAIVSNERFDSQTWQLRGFIYTELTGQDKMDYKEVALESFVKAREIDSSGGYTEKINGYIKNTLLSYYNHAVTLLKEENKPEESLAYYETYKEKYRELLDADYNFDDFDIQFYNALGATTLENVDLVTNDKKDDLRKKALSYCLKVIAIDSNNYSANFNAGIIYYNLGADLIMTMDPFATLEEIILNQKQAEEAFLKALPFLKKAEELNPSSVEVKEGLMGCYYGLNDNENYLRYQTMVDEVNLPSIIEKHQANPKNESYIKELIRIYSQTLIDKEKASEYRKKLQELNP